MTDFKRKMEDFIKQEKQVMKQFKDPDNIKAHKSYIVRTVSAMKSDALHQLMPLLEDKRRTLIRQYRGHNDELDKDIKELERDIKEIKAFTFRDEAIKISKNSKLKSYLAQEFRDLKAILKKKSFKDATPKFEESKHKRDKDGKFSSTGGGGTSAKSEPSSSERKPKRSATPKYDKNQKRAIAEMQDMAFDIADNFDKFEEMAGKMGIKFDDLDFDDDDTMDEAFDEALSRVDRYIKKNPREAIDIMYDYVGRHERHALEDEFTSYFLTEEEIAEMEEEMNNDSAIKDARIELKMGGRTIGYVEADTLLDAVRIYERQHPEARGKVNAYMADRRFKDASINDSLSEKAKQLISKAVAEARFDEARAFSFAKDDLRAEREWAWTTENEVRRFIKQVIAEQGR